MSIQEEQEQINRYRRDMALSGRVAKIADGAWQVTEFSAWLQRERDWAYEGDWVCPDKVAKHNYRSAPEYARDLNTAWDLIAWVIANRPDRVQEFDAVIAGHQPERLASRSLARLVCLEFLRHFEDDASQRDWYDSEIAELLRSERR